MVTGGPSTSLMEDHRHLGGLGDGQPDGPKI